MRTKKRLRWSREDGMYRAKRKTESATIVPSPEGGYKLVYQSHKCKRRVVVSTLREAKETAEQIRIAVMRRKNPIGMSPMLTGAAIGSVATALGVWRAKHTLPPKRFGVGTPGTNPLSSLSMIAEMLAIPIGVTLLSRLLGASWKRSLLIGGGVTLASYLIAMFMPTSASTAPQLPAAQPGLEEHTTLRLGTQTTVWGGGSLYVDLPSGAKNWTSVNGDSSYSGTTAPIQLPANPLGTYTFDYVDGAGNGQSGVLTVASTPPASGG